jgi:superfamily I DNA/RNA helicase
MNKLTLLVLLLLGLFACNPPANNTRVLQNRIDSLETRLAHSYTPGFGDFMRSMQVHHSKLWFAGINGNWKLTAFELHEIDETIEAIQKYKPEKEESKVIAMLQPALDSVVLAIQQENMVYFKSSYISLTNTCNDCHRATNFEFNVVKIPETPPFSNQEF